MTVFSWINPFSSVVLFLSHYHYHLTTPFPYDFAFLPLFKFFLFRWGVRNLGFFNSTQNSISTDILTYFINIFLISLSPIFIFSFCPSSNFNTAFLAFLTITAIVRFFFYTIFLNIYFFSLILFVPHYHCLLIDFFHFVFSFIPRFSIFPLPLYFNVTSPPISALLVSSCFRSTFLDYDKPITNVVNITNNINSKQQ